MKKCLKFTEKMSILVQGLSEKSEFIVKHKGMSSTVINVLSNR